MAVPGAGQLQSLDRRACSSPLLALLCHINCRGGAARYRSVFQPTGALSATRKQQRGSLTGTLFQGSSLPDQHGVRLPWCMTTHFLGRPLPACVLKSPGSPAQSARACTEGPTGSQQLAQKAKARICERCALLQHPGWQGVTVSPHRSCRVSEGAMMSFVCLTSA